jgi:hypothetical protein
MAPNLTSSLVLALSVYAVFVSAAAGLQKALSDSMSPGYGLKLIHSGTNSLVE